MSSPPGVLDQVEAALVAHFGHRPQRASVSFVGVDPIEVLRFEPVPGDRAYVSLGMSRHPMTGADQEVQNVGGPRAELMLQVRDPLDEYRDLWRQLAVLAAAPAVEGVVHAAGLSIDLGIPLSAGSQCTGVLVTESHVPTVETGVGPVEVLQTLPATSTELAWCRVHGSAALLERWTAARTDHLDLTRRPVRLE